MSRLHRSDLRDAHRLNSSACRSLAMAAVLVLAACFAPGARANWLAPVTVSAPHDQIDDLQLTSGAPGDLVSWNYWDLIRGKGTFTTPGSGYALAPAGGAFGAERRLAPSNANAAMVDLGAGRLARLMLMPSGANTSRPMVVLGGVAGDFGSPMSIPGASVFVGRASLAGNARGELLLAWIAADRNGGQRTVWASVRAPGGHFGRPRLISGGEDPEQVSAAAGPQGDLVIAFPSKRGRMLARVRRHGRRWGALENLGAGARGSENDVTPFVGADGRVVLAWYDTQLCEGGCESPGFTRVAVKPPGASRFRPARLLERDPLGLTGAPSGTSLAPIVLSVHGQAPMVLFLGAAATPSGLPPVSSAVVEAAYPSGLGFAAPQSISATDQLASDIAAAASPSGAIVTWISEQPPGYDSGNVFAATRLPTTGRFGPPEQISPSEHVLSALPTFNLSGHWPQNSPPWSVAWASRPEGEEAHTVVRVSSPLCEAPAPPLSATVVADPMCSGA
jgi:hypothetical protein